MPLDGAVAALIGTSALGELLNGMPGDSFAWNIAPRTRGGAKRRVAVPCETGYFGNPAAVLESHCATW